MHSDFLIFVKIVGFEKGFPHYFLVVEILDSNRKGAK